MNRKRFPVRMKVISTDLNELHEFTEEAVKELLQGLSGGLTEILFDDAVQTIIDGVNLTITVPAQRFAVQGAVGAVSDPPFTLPNVLATYRIFFIIGRVDVSAARDVLVLGPPLAVVTDPIALVEDDTVSRIEITSTGNPPVLGPTDIGYVELGSVIGGPGAWVVTHNTAALWVFPGLLPAAAPHAATHVTGGTDIIPNASPAAAGLMSAAYSQVLTAAIQNLKVDVASPFLVRVITGTNAPGDPKTVELLLRVTPDAFANKSMGGLDYLDLNYMPAGAYAGSSARPARSNHRHPPEESPVAMGEIHIAGIMVTLGSLLAEIEFTGIARIYHTEVFWTKPGVISPTYPAVPCGWMLTAAGTIGASAVITANNKIQVQTGSLGLAYLNAPTITLVRAGGAINWGYDSDPGLPKTGELFVRITGQR